VYNIYFAGNTYIHIGKPKYYNGFAKSVSRQRLSKHGQRATMEDVSQGTNVIAH
jgi:hypothetical protein